MESIQNIKMNWKTDLKTRETILKNTIEELKKLKSEKRIKKNSIEVVKRGSFVWINIKNFVANQTKDLLNNLFINKGFGRNKNGFFLCMIEKPIFNKYEFDTSTIIEEKYKADRVILI